MDSIDPLINLAIGHRDKGDFGESINLLEKAVQEDSHSHRALIHLGVSYHKAQRFEEAVTSLLAAVSMMPAGDCPEYVPFTALKSALQCGQAASTLDALKQAGVVSRASTRLLACVCVAESLSAARHPVFLEDFEILLSREDAGPEKAWAVQQITKTLLDKNQPDGFLELFPVLERNGYASGQLHVSFAVALRKTGNRLREAGVYENIIARYSPGQLPCYFGKLAAETFLYLGLKHRAMEFLRDCYLLSKPEGLSVGVSEKILDMASAIASPAEFDDLFRILSSLPGASGQFLVARAHWLLNSGNPAGAVEVLLNAADAIGRGQLNDELAAIYLKQEDWRSIEALVDSSPTVGIAKAIAAAHLQGLASASPLFAHALRQMEGDLSYSRKLLNATDKYLSALGIESYRFARFFGFTIREKIVLQVAFLNLYLPKQCALNQDYIYCLMMLGKTLGFDEDFKSVCLDDIELNGIRSYSIAGLANVSYNAGDVQGLDDGYKLAKQLALAEAQECPKLFDKSLGHFCGIFTWDESGKPEVSERPKVEFDPASAARTAGATKLVHLVGCDPGYMRRFLPSMLKVSSLEHAAEAGVVMHCNVMNPSADDRQFLRALQADYPFFEFSITQAGDHYNEIAFFTCLRFLVLSSVMAAHQAAVLVTDIDACVKFSWKGVVQNLSEWDLLFSAVKDPFDKSGIPCQVGAGATYISNSPIGQAFANRVAGFINDCYDPAAITNWCIDQVALRKGILHVEERLGAADRVSSFYKVGNPIRFANAFDTKEEFVHSLASTH